MELWVGGSYLLVMRLPADSACDVRTSPGEIPPFQWIFASPIVRIGEYRCTTPAGATEGRVEAFHAIVMPSSGTCWVESEDQTAIADANVFLYLNASSSVRTRHFSGSGDAGHTLVLRPDLLWDAAGASSDPLRPFARLQAPSSPRAFLLKQVLLEHVVRPSSVEDIAVEEIALTFAEEAFPRTPGRVSASNHGGGTAKVHREWVESVKAFVGRRLADPIRLDDIAAEVHVSAFHLCRVFKASTQLSIHQYLNRLRLRAALERVVDPSVNLMTLALDLGFSSHSHFSFAFRREHGMSPTLFRRSARAHNLEEAFQRLSLTGSPRCDPRSVRQERAFFASTISIAAVAGSR
jgi:AraC family transcriptional regulator